jgi:ferritin-like metal-binding protein YciE
MPRDIDEQLTKYLTDAHSIEVQALAQLRTAPDLAGAPELVEAFRSHLVETDEHERTTRELLERRWSSRHTSSCSAWRRKRMTPTSQPRLNASPVTSGR